MALELRDMRFVGAALPEPFVKFELEALLAKWSLLPRLSAAEARALEAQWEPFRRKLRMLAETGMAHRVAAHVLHPLGPLLGYDDVTRAESVRTREGDEDGGWLLRDADGHGLRAWSVDLGSDLDAPARRGRAYRFSPARIAERVLLERGERVGLLTDGYELRLVLCDPARTGSHLAVRLDRAGGWRGAKGVPDSFRLLRALASPRGVARVPELVEAARLAQTRVTQTLRQQAQSAVLGFVQSLLDDPRNAPLLAPRRRDDPAALAQSLWREALVMVYRLLFVLRLESTADPARAFSFASTSLWRNTWSPNTALAPYVRMRLDQRVETGAMLSEGLRAMFRLFAEGVSVSELRVTPLGGMLFGPDATPLLDSLAWSDDAVARLLDRILWTPGGAAGARQRVHYGALEVEDLGRVYEALLEREPGLSTEPMCRLRRQKLEVVVPAHQGARYRKDAPAAGTEAVPADEGDADADEGDEAETSKAKARVLWVEDIPAGRFYLRAGLGRKSTGSYYTPDAFVRFLVEKTLGPLVEARSPVDDPQPLQLLALKVLDPAMGSGHFLVGACRYLADKLYEACRLCDEKAAEHTRRAEQSPDPEARAAHQDSAADYLQRVQALPDPNDELLAWLPSRAEPSEGAGLAQARAVALCRRLVAVHCLYGVDKNPLAVELARLALWLESYAEGLPLTFLDHRLVCGDALTGPFLEHLGTLPGQGIDIDRQLFGRVGARLLQPTLAAALDHVRDLEASVGKDVAEVEAKRAAKARLDAALGPLRRLAQVWSGGVLLGPEASNDPGYAALVTLATHADADRDAAMEALLRGDNRLAAMRDAGASGVAFDLVFPEVFWPDGYGGGRRGFDAVLGNPPWDALQPLAKEFFAAYDLRVLDAPTRRERAEVEQRVSQDPDVAAAYRAYVAGFDCTKRLLDRVYRHVGRSAHGAPSGASTDLWQPFAERAIALLRDGGSVGIVVPSAFHANQSATGLRALYLEQSALRCCLSFENVRKLFEIDSRFKFALVAATRGGGEADAFDCAFYLDDPEWLFNGGVPLRFTRDFVRATGGAYLSLMELRSEADAAVAASMYQQGIALGDVLTAREVRLGRELHMTDDAHRFTPTDTVLPVDDPRDPAVAQTLRARGYLPLHEGKTFHQYDDRWEDRPRYLVALAAVADKPAWREAARYYRLAFRDIARSTDERTGIFGLLPPGVLCGNKAPCERQPAQRPSAQALLLLAVANTFAFDWTLRLKVAATVNLFILEGCPVPAGALEGARARFLAHGALRLSCNHAGYAALWHEQLGDAWAEASPRGTWPAVSGDARQALRAALDAVVAEAYGLSRAQYAHVLGGFSHRSDPTGAARCLAAYDALQSEGLAAFVRARDPYDAVALVDALPQPVLTWDAGAGGDAPAAGGQQAFAGMDGGAAPGAKRGRRR